MCGRWSNRPVTVSGVLIEDGRVLLILRGGEPERGRWALPGGYLDPDETAAQGCEREMLEETGLSVRTTRPIGYFDDPQRSPAQTVAIAFLVERIAGEPVAGDDAADAAWFALNALPHLAFDHTAVLRAALS